MNNEKLKATWDCLGPSQESRERILAKVQAGKKQHRRKPSIKVLLIAAAIMALASTTLIAAYSNSVREIMLGRSRVMQTESVENPNVILRAYCGHNESFVRVLDSFYLGIYTEDDRPTIASQRGDIATVEEANRYAPFTIVEPAYVPAHLHLGLILLPRYYDGSYARGVILSYVNDIGAPAFCITQRYIGLNGYFVFKSTHYIETVMIGDIEAVLVTNPNGGANPGQVSRELKWVSNGIFYILRNIEAHDARGYNLTFSLETMVAIANSIR